MIYAERHNPNEEIFLEILENSKNTLVFDLQNNQPLPNPTQFESLVCEMMKTKATGTEFEGTIRQTGVSAFPDIVANGYFGVEVKTTIKDHWRSTGNSVLESLREEGVKKIYILFGKLGGTPDVKYRLYQECLPTVSVTHSPRYQIDMNLPEGRSIFDKMAISYDELRMSGDTIQQIKSYYRSQLKEGEGLWWIDEETESSSPIIKQFRTLEPEEKERFKVDCMILFPELFKKRANYERAATYLITEFSAVYASLRDAFSAGGQEEIKVVGEKKNVSQMFSRLFEYAPHIAERINTIDMELLKFYWQVAVIEEKRIDQWKALINEQSGEGLGTELPSEVFQSGCEEAKLR